MTKNGIPVHKLPLLATKLRSVSSPEIIIKQLIAQTDYVAQLKRLGIKDKS